MSERFQGFRDHNFAGSRRFQGGRLPSPTAPADVLPTTPAPLSEGRNFRLDPWFTFAVGGVIALISQACSPAGGSPLETPTPTPIVEPTKTPTATEAPKPSPTPEISTMEQVFAQIETVKQALLNPDPNLVAKYQIPEDRIRHDQIVIIWGGTKGQQIVITPDSLEGVKKRLLESSSLTSKDKKEIMEIIKQIFDWTRNPLLSRDGKTTDETLWTKEEVEQIDPRRIFILPPRVTGGSSAIKEEAAKGVIRLGYAITALPVGK